MPASNSLTVKIKYCGGCNPHYDRAAIAKTLLAEYPNITLADSDDALPDLVAVVCGCSNCCASHDHLQSRYGSIVLAVAQDYDKLAKAVQQHIYSKGII